MSKIITPETYNENWWEDDGKPTEISECVGVFDNLPEHHRSEVFKLFSENDVKFWATAHSRINRVLDVETEELVSGYL